MKTVPRKKRRVLKALAMALRIVSLIALAAILWFVYILWQILTVDNTPNAEPADVGIVLGAALWKDKPSPGLKERLEEAYRVFQEGRVRALIVTGGLDGNSSRLTEAEGMAKALVAMGVPKDRIVLENKATNTYENLLFSKRLMDDKGWKSAVIITHRYHGARSLDIARYLGFENPVVSTTPTKVMNVPWNTGREVLAYSKWMADKLLLDFGAEDPISVR